MCVVGCCFGVVNADIVDVVPVDGMIVMNVVVIVDGGVGVVTFCDAMIVTVNVQYYKDAGLCNTRLKLNYVHDYITFVFDCFNPSNNCHITLKHTANSR